MDFFLPDAISRRPVRTENDPSPLTPASPSTPSSTATTVPDRALQPDHFSYPESVATGQRHPDPWPNRVNILFSGANRDGRAQLNLEKECRAIESACQKVFGLKWTDHVCIRPIFFSRFSELVENLNSWSTTILHFACHGEEECLEFFDDIAGKDDLTRKISATSGSTSPDRVRMVVLNACFSDSLAESLANHVDFVIGHHGPVKDATAINFSSNLYSCIAKGMSLHSSFEATWVPAYTLRGQADPTMISFMNHMLHKTAHTSAVGGWCPMVRGALAKQAVIVGVAPDDHTRYQQREQYEEKVELWLQITEAGTLVMTGLPGSGKTTLAKTIASKAARAYHRELVIFLRSSTMMEDYVSVAKKLAKMVNSDANASDFAAMSEEELKHFVHSCLSDELRERWFCVIDDAPNPENEVESASIEHIRAFPFGYGSTLITSRFPEWAEDRGGTDDCMEVGSFSTSEACSWVMRGMGSQWKNVQEQVVEMVSALQLFPLAIEQSVAYCRENLVSTPRDFLRKMKEAPMWELKPKEKRNRRNEYHESFEQVFCLVCQQLTENADEEDPSGIHNLLRKLAFLHPDDIPAEILDSTERRYVAVLRKFSLVSRESLSVHAMTQAAVREVLMGRSRIATMKALSASMNAKMKAFDSGKESTYVIGARYARHAKALVSHIHDSDEEMLASSIVQLVQTAAEYLQEIVCHYREAQFMLEKLLALIRKHPEGHCSAMAQMLYDLGIGLHDQGMYAEALERYEESLAIQERLLGREHIDIAARLTCIGSVLHDQGKYPEALERYEESLAIQERLVGRESKDVAASLANIGRVLHDQGKYTQALERYVEGLGIQERLEKEHMDVARSLTNIGIVLWDQGKYSEARTRYEESMAIQERLVGREHMEVAANLSNVGKVLSNQGKYPQALEKYEESMAIQERLVGREHMEVAASLACIGIVLHEQGKYEAAMEKHAESLAIQERLVGREHLDVCESMTNIGIVLGDQGRYSEAMQRHEESLAIKERLVGREHMGVAENLANIGIVLANEGKYAEAMEKHKESLAIQEKLVGKEHLSVAANLANIGIVLCDQGRYAESMERHAESLSIQERSVGRDHMGVAENLSSVGRVLSFQGKYDEALERYEESLAIQTRLVGREHTGSLIAICCIGDVKFMQGKYGDSLRMYAEAESWQRRLCDQAGAFSVVLQRFSLSLEAMERQLHQDTAASPGVKCTGKEVLVLKQRFLPYSSRKAATLPS